MIRRIGIACAAMAMWLMFGLVVGFAFVCFPLLSLAWVAFDSDWLRKRLTSYGQGLDSCANVVLLDGSNLETISSHVGRMYTAKYGNMYKNLHAVDKDYPLTWQARLVRRLTDIAEPDHIYKSVELWAVDSQVPL